MIKKERANNKYKRAGESILSEKIQFKTKNITRDKKGHFIMIKESIHRKI